MKLRKKYDTVYPDATMLLRPKTGLKDMVVEMDPGNSSSGRKLKDGATIPISQTQPDVNLDEILAALDTDTRTYLRLLLGGGGQGLRDNTNDLSSTLRRLAPRAATWPRSSASSRSAGSTSAAPCTTSSSWPTRSVTRTTSSPSSWTRPTRSSAPSPRGRQHPRHARPAAADPERDPGHAGQDDRRWPTRSARRCRRCDRRPRARPVTGRDPAVSCASPRRSCATRSARSRSPPCPPSGPFAPRPTTWRR
jgi:hypothetical protein